MEAEAGCAGSRKRKLQALEAPALALAAGAAVLPSPESAVDGQDPPLPGAEGGAGDRISQLPDGVLGDIISLLPTKEGARTQVLASRWRHLWRSAPLNLDHHWLCQLKDLDAVVSRILAAHPGPGRRFCAPVYHLDGDRADSWLRSPAIDNLYELELCSYTPLDRLPFPPQTLPPPPAAAFRFSETLGVATIGECHLADSTVQALHFPKLQKLGLKRVSISESSLHTMIAACPALECLLIENSTGFRCVRINSTTLRGISVGGYHFRKELRFEELVIENVPCLQSLLQLGSSGCHISVISAPKLKALGYLSCGSSKRFVFESAVIQGMRVESLTTTVLTIKILAVDMHCLSLDAVINLIRCFPCLERLYIQANGPGDANLWRRKHRSLVKSFDMRLKTVVWRTYRAIKSHVDFATFFLLNARVLELMTFEVNLEDYNEAFFAQQREALQVDSRASRGARLCFTSDWSYHYILNSSVHDLDPADPFERTQPPKADTNFVLCGNC